MTYEDYEDVPPNPSYLIKSISEQGYSLETSLADLIDNSIAASANAVEVLVAADAEPFTLFLADNGRGMSEDELKHSMTFPSASPEDGRDASDLGRFGLGMKTASFAQTRKFTVISRRKGTTEFKARTWDVDALEHGHWRLNIPSESQLSHLLRQYRNLSKGYLSRFDDFTPNTIVVWHGLRKFEEHLAQINRRKALSREITEVTADHLSLVFHRFMEDLSAPLLIRVNNTRLKPFSPFPMSEKGIRRLEVKKRKFSDDQINLEGFVLPSSAIDAAKTTPNVWTPRSKSLTDMEGMFFYRQGRLISYGGWNGVIRKEQKLQLARLKVELGNRVDHLLHLNVAKSRVIIPHDLHSAFLTYASELKAEATKSSIIAGLGVHR